MNRTVYVTPQEKGTESEDECENNVKITWNKTKRSQWYELYGFGLEISNGVCTYYEDFFVSWVAERLLAPRKYSTR
jgi:hypothetical protein